MYSRPHGYLPSFEDPYNRWLGEAVQYPQHQPTNYHQQADMSHVFNATNRYNALWVFVDIEATNLDPLGANFGILEIAAGVVDDDMSIIDTFHVVVHQPRHIIRGASKWCKQHFCSRLEGGNDLFSQCEASTISETDAGNMLHEFILKHAKKRNPETNAVDNMRRKYFREAEFGDIADVVEKADLPPPTLSKDAETEFVPQNLLAVKDDEENHKTEYYRIMLCGCSIYFDRSVLLARFPQLRSIIGHKTIEVTSMLEIARRWRPDLLRTLPPATSSHRALVDLHETLVLLRWFWRSVMAAATFSNASCC